MNKSGPPDPMESRYKDFDENDSRKDWTKKDWEEEAGDHAYHYEKENQ